MDINLELTNEEDIHYLNGVSENNREACIKTAITIGLKSIQMSAVNMDCNSYIEPIREIITESTEENGATIRGIDDKLDALLHIRTNSSRKGRLSEDICINRLMQNYPSWDFTNVTQMGHEGDCKAVSPIGDILYEFKSYDTNVNKEQINKFYQDLEITGVKFGIFVSNTSGIVGKNNLEWEIIGSDTLVVYISNMGFNGHGCIMATELLLALAANNIMDSENNWLMHQNYQTDEVYANLVQSLDDYRSDTRLINKLHKHVKDHRMKMNTMIDSLESEIFQIVLNSEVTFSKIVGLVETIKSKDDITHELNIDDYILQSKHSPKFTSLFIQLHKICAISKLRVSVSDNEWLIHRDSILIAKTRTLKSKVQLIIHVIPKQLMLDVEHEEYRDKNIIIELNDSYKLWETVELRFA
tara:strand:- start:336 stop:1574 length:1239 start_codon:yes stop_codon:yes gene_type:complete